jgi:N utilization substance protein B
MISRRNIRIKVFQTIYELTQQHENVTEQDLKKCFDAKVGQSAALFATITHLLIVICDYTVVYANQRASKLMPTAEDLNFNTKLSGNAIIGKLKHNASLSEALKKAKTASIFDNEFVKRLFVELIDTAEYKSYIQESDRTPNSEKQILTHILTSCIFANEFTKSYLEEQFINWTLDAEAIETWMEKPLVNGGSQNFTSILSKEKLDFAHDLLTTYAEKKDVVFELIEPKLVNWDAERVAIVDLILLHLGICELLYFPSIPVKVTINEYIDLAKQFSTLQSGQFVNGLLDNVRKELTAANRIHKDEFKK